MKPTYTTATGLQIGLRYETTAKPHHDSDALKLQGAYLGDEPVWDWDGIVIIIGCALLMAAPYLFLAALS